MAEFETTFADLGLKAPILEALNDLGYEKPSPIQAECIPHLLSGRDVLGMAQTGSGKTAAFSLPLLNNIDPDLRAPQILVLAPTRELAVQVAEAMTEFSKHMRGVNVVALYGGQRYDVQLRALRQGPQIVVGTPGRLLDHLKRGTLDLSKLSGLVLDEADEMLRMGFIEDVETIMAQIPEGHQTALVLCNHARSDPSHYPPLHERAAGSAYSVQRDHSPGHQPELLVRVRHAQKRSAGPFPGSGRF